MNFLLIYYLSLFLFASGQNTNSSTSVLQSDCGTTRLDNTSKRIIMGDKAALGQFPWMARLGILRYRRTFFFCGGSLVSKYYVITAAHCSQSQGNIVRLGENYVNTLRDCDEDNVCAPLPQDIRIKRFIHHSNYCFYRTLHDIAVVELTRPAEFNEFVRPICLPSSPIPHEDLMNEPLTISGWGLTRSRPPIYPNYLMFITAPLVGNEQCNKLYHSTLLDSQLCIGYPKGKDSCNGDSGGPVTKTVEENGVKRSYLIGVVSYGLMICGAGPAVYTDVSYFQQWTSDIIKTI